MRNILELLVNRIDEVLNTNDKLSKENKDRLIKIKEELTGFLLLDLTDKQLMFIVKRLEDMNKTIRGMNDDENV